MQQNSTWEKQNNLTDPQESWKAKGCNRFYILRELFQQGSGLHLTKSSWVGQKEKQNDNKLARNTYISFVLSLRE